MGLSMSRVGVLWSSVAMVRSSAAHLAARLAEAVEGLRAGHLVQQVQIDEEEVGLALRAPDDMVVPDLLRECPYPSLSLRPAACAGPTRDRWPRPSPRPDGAAGPVVRGPLYSRVARSPEN